MPKINTIETNPKQSQLKTLKQPGQKKLAKDSSTIFFFTAVATYTAYEATLKIFLKSYSNFGETIKENLSV